MQNLSQFIKKYKLTASDIDMEAMVQVFQKEMDKGLQGTESSLRMIPTYIEADNSFSTNVPVLAIDAGGTNFRAALISISADGTLETNNEVRASMPGLDYEISRIEFFNIIAGYVKPLAEKADRIGFCFSYPTEILPDKDGILLQFCKEIKAPEVVGERIGKNLLEALGMPGHKIVLLNDTVATLLAGKSASLGKTYDSFVGYILGTGTNTCYIENNKSIVKNPELDQNRSQIINIESGNFAKALRSPLDIGFDNTTNNPGNYTFEKMFSGGYFGALCLYILKIACNEDVFSRETAQCISVLNQLSSEEVNLLVSGKSGSSLGEAAIPVSDLQEVKYLFNNLIDRSAKLVAANLAAVILKTGKGKESGKPILVTVEGTTFYKLHGLKERFEQYFNEFLSGDQKRFVEFAGVAQSSLVGAALSALIE